MMQSWMGLGMVLRCSDPTSKVVLDISNGVFKINEMSLMKMENTFRSTAPGSFRNCFAKMQSENDMLPELDSLERKTAGSTVSCGKGM